MKNITCAFTGHRDLPIENYDIIASKTKDEIEKLINSGIKKFISGGAIGFDMLCGNLVAELKQAYKDTQLIMALPCKEQDKYWNDEQKQSYNKLLQSADKIIYVSDKYFRGAMHKRNRYIVDNSEYIISYCTKESGGTYYTKKYAEKQNRTIINIL